MHFAMGTDATLTELGRRVRMLRGEQGLTLQELAARLGPVRALPGAGGAGQREHLCAQAGGPGRALGTTPAALLTAPADPGRATIALLGPRGGQDHDRPAARASRMRLKFVELDQRIEKAAGLTLPEIFALARRAVLPQIGARDAGARCSTRGPLVLATGGGLPDLARDVVAPEAPRLTARLRAQPEDHWNRVVQQGDKRPMADNPQAMAELRRLLAARGTHLRAGPSHRGHHEGRDGLPRSRWRAAWPGADAEWHTSVASSPTR